MRQRYFASTQLISVLTGLLAITVYVFLTTDSLLEQKTGFLILNLILTAFLAIEINRVRNLQSVRWLLNPAVLCSLVTFFIYFVISNIIYYLPVNRITALGINPNITLAMNKLMLLVILGAIAMWLGYWSPVCAHMLRKKPIYTLQYKYFNADSVTKPWVIPIFYILANIGRLIEVSLGIYGYSSNYERVIAAASYSQYLTTLDDFGALTLIITALQYYSRNTNARIRLYFFIILFGEFAWGLLAGMKGHVMGPFIVVLIIQYLRYGRMSKSWLILIPIVIVIAYSVVEPFRNERNKNPNFEPTSVTSIVNAMIIAQERQHYNRREVNDIHESNSTENVIQQENDAGVLLKFLGRTNLVHDASFGIEFADKNKELPPGSPDFGENLLDAFITAFIPRFILHDKTLNNIGLWYSQVVMGQVYSRSSTAMSIFTNMYFTGGIIAVLISFYIIGIVQRVIFFSCKPWLSAAGAVVYMAFMTKFEIIGEADLQTIIPAALRILPIVLILQSFIFRHTPKALNDVKP